MKYLPSILTAVLVLLGASVLSYAYKATRPTPVSDVIADKDYTYRMCKLYCFTCVTRRWGELAISHNDFQKRCAKFSDAVYISWLFKYYSYDALKFSDSFVGENADDLADLEVHAFEYDVFVKRHGRKPTTEDINPYFGLYFSSLVR